MKLFSTIRRYKSDDIVKIEEENFRGTDDDLQNESLAKASKPSEETELEGNRNDKYRGFKFIPLKINGRTHVISSASRKLIANEVTLKDLEKMTSLFYDKAFKDKTLDKFIRSHGDPHAERFAKWIHSKLSGSDEWNKDREERDLTPVQLANGVKHVVHDRSSAHAAAWYSPKRPKKEVGRHFRLDECRVWMRLHFWAMRESGLLEKSPSFVDYYVRFIGHFVRVYEQTAPNFARESFRWSGNTENIRQYVKNGHQMKDVLGLSLGEAVAQIPQQEALDDIWPYNLTEMESISQ